MGKKSQQKDRLYLTAKEHKEEWGGYKQQRRIPFQRLPFHCCAISFTPFEEPVCTDDGTVFDILNIVPYIKKYGRHPVKGTPLELADLISLNFHKNGDGEYACPVTGKVFTEHTHIVAVKPTGNVYAWDSVDQLCIKPKNWKDLLTDEPFTRKDIITLQDPLNMTAKLITDFDHVKKDLAVGEPSTGEEGSSLRNMSEDMKRTLNALGTSEAAAAMAGGGGGKRAEAARALAEARLQRQKAAAGAGGAAAAAAAAGGGGAGNPPAAGAAAKPGSTAAAAAGAGGGDWRLTSSSTARTMPSFKPGAVTWDTDDHGAAAAADAGKKKKKGGAGAAGAPEVFDANGGKPNPKAWYDATHAKYVSAFTSTGAMARGFTSTVAASVVKQDLEQKRLDRNPTKKGYARIHTSLGDLNVELHADLVPRTCENWLALARLGYYDGVKFHRSIKNFMIQGGDPTGTGKGGESIYGPTFKDELDSRLLHAGRGILSMANSGPGTNGSQFFITYKSAPHLNYKHAVFGRVVGGLEVLGLMERVPTDDEDRPLQDITITGVTVFADPFLEMEQAEADQAAADAKKADADNPALPENQKGSWYSNPGAAHTAAAGANEGGTGGVGKYLSAATLAAAAAAGDKRKLPPGGGAPAAAGQAANGAAGGAGAGAKKPKVQQQALANFDAW